MEHWTGPAVEIPRTLLKAVVVVPEQAHLPSPSDRPSPAAPARSARRSLLSRLGPFLRRDLRPRLLSAAVAAGLLGGVTYLGVSALTEVDSRPARDLRVSLGIEDAFEVCDGPYQPACSFDDRQQEEVDRLFASEQHLRVAILRELVSRADRALGNLARARELLAQDAALDLHGELFGGRKDLTDLLLTTVDLRPLTTRDQDLERTNALQRAAYSLTVEGGRVRQGGREALLREIDTQELALSALRTELHGHLGALHDDDDADPRPPVQRQATWAELFNRDPYGSGGELAGWLLADGGQPTVSAALAGLALGDKDRVAGMVFDRRHELWRGTFEGPAALAKPSVRYRSPVAPERQWQLFGAALLGLASLFFLVVGPVATATQTAREREAGTLPVLRMTGLTAGDLALAMALGPNVFASAAGGLLLLLGVLALAFTAGPAALLAPVGALMALAITTHLTAIGLGDALGHRVNALLVGALMAFGIVAPGLVGGALVLADIAGSGLLLGPLPAALGGVAELTGLPGTHGAMVAHSSDLGSTILGTSLVLQALLGGVCLLSWRRRVEQAWAPLFRPAEGVALALASVACSGLTLLDLSERVNTQSFDSLNLVTFLASAFLLPLLGWLLVSSLPRPARAAAVASHVEVRRAFWRFQGVLAATVGVVALTYNLVMHRSGLAGEASEVMWATLTQVLLVVETAIGALLWTSRRRDGKHRIAMLSGALIVLQVAFAAIVYRLEVDFVAATHRPGSPFLLGMESSPYWIGFMILLWGLGLGLILTALLRDRDRIADEAAARPRDDEGGDDDQPRGRWLH